VGTAPQLPPIFFEDLHEGLEDITPGRTITAADVSAFAGLSGDYNQIHTDAVFAAEHGLGGELLAHGMLGTAISSGLYARCALGIAMQPQLIALLEINWRYLAPIRVGDTLHVLARVTGRRETSDPARGVVEMERQLVNQSGFVTQEGRLTLLVRRRPTR
jgi:3-hydroxybutyryl-CoA dehydratase